MTIDELKISTYLYRKFTNYDKNYIDIADRTFNLTLESDQNTVLQFLRDWGCRQFKKENHKESAKGLSEWFRKYSDDLKGIQWNLVDAIDADILKCDILFQDLMNTFASTKRNGKTDIEHTVGPVGAAKLLFALKKNCFAPWDRPIIDKLNFSKDGIGYVGYLFHIRQELTSLKADCELKGIDFNNLPTLLEQHYASLPKLIDEHLWVSITRQCNPSEIIELTKKNNERIT